MKKTIATLLAATMLISFLLSFSSCASAKELNLDGYELVFCDEFEGDSLDLTKWEYRKNGERRGGYNHPDQVSVSNGNLIFTAEYGEKEYGEGWYAGMIKLTEEYKYGYFEIRCIANESKDFWSAFWMTTEGVYDHDISKGGVGGAELDIFESFSSIKKPRNKKAISSTVYCNGSDSDPNEIDSQRITKEYVKTLRSDYNTFGMLWTENEYVFYINGKETGRTSFGSGVSEVGENVIVSLEIPDEITLDKSETTQFIVDYVKIYQLEK